MSLTFTSTTPGTSSDYMKYVYDQPVKTDRDGEAVLLDFTLASTDTNFVKLNRGNYIKITTNTYATWYTGYIQNEPEYVYLGEQAGVPYWGWTYEASSDEIILSQNALGIIPPFMNMTQGQIIKALANQIAPGLFDVTNVSDGLTLARYVVDPTQKFSDIVKAFATAAVYRFWGQDHKLYFVDKTTIPQGLTVDASDIRFTPSALTVKASVDIPIVNDALVMGDIEPQRHTTEYFVGSGFDGEYSLSSSVFGVESVILLDDDFSNSSFDTAKWVVYDQPSPYMLISNGFMNVIGGMADGSYGVHLDSASLIQLGGAMRIAHCEFDFVPQNSDNAVMGVICGLWTQAPNSSYTGCVYGIEVSKTSGVVTLKPIVNGVVDSSKAQVVDTNGQAGNPAPYDSMKSYVVGNNVTYLGQFYVCYANTTPGNFPTDVTYWAVATAKRYVVRTLISNQTVYPTTQSYAYLDASGVRRSVNVSPTVSGMAFHTYVTELDPNTGLITPGFPIIWTNAFDPTTDQVFANYILAASDDLHVTVTGLTISTPMQATLGLQTFGAPGFINKLVGPNEIDATDGLAPYATVSQSGGVNQKQNILGTKQYNFGSPTLTFFKDTSALTTTVPQRGDVVRLDYRSAGAALGRCRNDASITTEAFNWGDAGIRSSVRGDLSPLPRTAQECESAAAAIIGQNDYTHYEGAYTVPSQNVTAEPVAGALLPFTNLPSSFPVTSFVEPIQSVKTTLLSVNGSEEFFSHEITYGLKGDSQRLQKVLSGFTKQTDVFTTTDSAETPKYVPTTGIGLSFSPDVTTPRMDPTNGGTHGPWIASHAHTLNQIILDPNGNLQKLTTTTGNSGSTTPAWVNAQNDIVPIGSVLTGSQVSIVSGVLTIWSPISVLGMLNIGTQLALTIFTNAPFLNGMTITVATIAPDGMSYTAAISHADYATYADTGTCTVTASGGVSLQTKDGANNVWTLIGHAYGVDSSNFYYDMGMTPPTGGSFEVRYSDDSWGCDNGTNLAGRFTTQTFSLPRLKRNALVFVKAQDGRNLARSSENWVGYDGSNRYNGTPWNFGDSNVTLVKGLDPDGNLTLLNQKVLGLYATDYLKHQTITDQAFAPGDYFTATLDVKGTAGQYFLLSIWGSTGTELPEVDRCVLLNGQWQRVSITAQVPSAITAGTGLGVYVMLRNPCIGATGLPIGYSIPSSITILGTRVSIEKASAETVYCKTQDAGTANSTPSYYGATSRYAASVKCSYPLIPNPPTAFVDATDVQNPIVNVVLPSVADDVWGIEIRANDNSTVLYHDDLTDSGYSAAYTVVNNATRSLGFYVYTYNLLGEYSATSYQVSFTIPTPTISGLSVVDTTQTLTWNFGNATGFIVEIDSHDSSFAQDDVNQSIADSNFALSVDQFFLQNWFRITPFDGIGNGTPVTLSHEYAPDPVNQWNGNEVFSVPPPPTSNTDPTLPSTFPTASAGDYLEAVWKNYQLNQGRLLT